MRLLLLTTALMAIAGTAMATGDPGRGRAVAEARSCGTCHGVQGVSAMPNIPSLAGQPEEFITLQMILFRERLRQAPPMPDLAQGLSDEDIENLAAHFAALSPAPAADRGGRDATRFEAGAVLAERLRCGICHLPDYRGQAQIPRLSGQRAEYLAQSLVQYRDGSRHGTDTNMNAVMYGVGEAEIAALAHYMAQQ